MSSSLSSDSDNVGGSEGCCLMFVWLGGGGAGNGLDIDLSMVGLDGLNLGVSLIKFIKSSIPENISSVTAIV